MDNKTKKIIDETNNIIGDLSKNLNKLMAQSNNALNNLPQDQRDQVVKHQAHVNKIMKTIKTGDIEKIQQIINSHANTNS
jgi:DNA-binding FadR family transcriptional regulator